jgi:hypothetical protein
VDLGDMRCRTLILGATGVGAALITIRRAGYPERPLREQIV